MISENLPYEAVKNIIAKYKAITILSHLNPDADALGTALGIYALFAEDKSKKVEVVNASTSLPIHLDFLPNFKKIKHQMDYTDSLVISCDCGSLDRLGFELSGREILNIDHHQSNTKYGSINAVLPQYASSSQVAFSLFEKIKTINKDTATCFYTALLSDTRYFTTSSVNEEVFNVAQKLVALGVKPDVVSFNLTQRRPLSSFRILEKALASLCLTQEAKVATLQVTKEEIAQTGATVSDMDGIADYAKSLVTVEIALFAMELDDGVRISLRSKNVDISKVAMAFNGGGHKVAAGFTIQRKSCKDGLQECINKVLEKITALGVLNEK
ncbi:MAG: DHH family phosphoesterase [Sulfurovum sp.]|nr:DHH family phosphoesterase [Sulfurovum sp.]